MQRQPYAIPGGADGLRLSPETPSEAAFTPAERALICAMLKRSVSDQRLAAQLDLAMVLLRELDGYGAFIEFAVAEPPAASTSGGPVDDADTIFWTQDRGGGGLNAFITSSGGHLVIDIYPLDGDNYSTQECERVLFGDPSGLTFHPFWPESGKRLKP